MASDPYSLDNLRDIVIPDPPPFWPPAPGFWIALATVVLIALLAGWTLRAHRRRHAYRRAGLRLLEEARTVHDISVAMKRVALAAFPRQQVASLYGDEWAAFLRQTCGRCDVSALPEAEASAAPGKEFVDLAVTWIRHHRVPKTTAAHGGR